MELLVTPILTFPGKGEGKFEVISEASQTLLGKNWGRVSNPPPSFGLTIPMYGSILVAV